MCINNTSHLIYPIKRSNNRKLFIGNTKFTLERTKIANFNSAKTFKIANSQTLISANISSFTVFVLLVRRLKKDISCLLGGGIYHQRSGKGNILRYQRGKRANLAQKGDL